LMHCLSHPEHSMPPLPRACPVSCLADRHSWVNIHIPLLVTRQLFCITPCFEHLPSGLSVSACGHQPADSWDSFAPSFSTGYFIAHQYSMSESHTHHISVSHTCNTQQQLCRRCRRWWCVTWNAHRAQTHLQQALLKTSSQRAGTPCIDFQLCWHTWSYQYGMMTVVHSTETGCHQHQHCLPLGLTS
jgi:hypothetical protein